MSKKFCFRQIAIEILVRNMGKMNLEKIIEVAITEHGMPDDDYHRGEMRKLINRDLLVDGSGIVTMVKNIYKPVDINDNVIEKKWKELNEIFYSDIEKTIIFYKIPKMDMLNPLDTKFIKEGNIKNTNLFHIMDGMDGIELNETYIKIKNIIENIVKSHDALNKNEEIRMVNFMFSGNDKLFPIKLNELVNIFIMIWIIFGDEVAKLMFTIFLKNDIVNISVFQALSGLELTDRLSINKQITLSKFENFNNENEIEIYEQLEYLHKEIYKRNLGDIRDYVFAQQNISMPIFIPNFDQSPNKKSDANYFSILVDNFSIPLHQVLSLKLDHSVFPRFQFEIVYNFGYLNKLIGYPLTKIFNKGNVNNTTKKITNKVDKIFSFLPTVKHINNSILLASNYWIQAKFETDPYKKCHNYRLILEYITKEQGEKKILDKLEDIIQEYGIEHIISRGDMSKFMKKMAQPPHHSGLDNRFSFKLHIFKKMEKLCRKILIKMYNNKLNEKSYQEMSKLILGAEIYKPIICEDNQRNPRYFEKLYYSINKMDKENLMNNYRIETKIQFDNCISEIDCEKIYNSVDKNLIININEQFSVDLLRNGKHILLDGGKGVIYYCTTDEFGSVKMMPYCTNNGKKVIPHEIKIDIKFVKNSREIKMINAVPKISGTHLNPYDVVEFTKDEGLESALEEWPELSKEDIEAAIKYVDYS